MHVCLDDWEQREAKILDLLCHVIVVVTDRDNSKSDSDKENDKDITRDAGVGDLVKLNEFSR